MVGTRSLAWLGALAVAALALMLAAPTAPGREIEARGQALLAPLGGLVRDAVHPVADALLQFGQAGELSEENAALRRDVARLESELAALREAGIAQEQAAALIAAVGEDAGAFTTAAVTLRDPSPARSVLVIDRGSADGVRAGQPVVGPGGTLVGLVSTVEDGHARVRLLNDSASAVTAVVQGSRAPVVVAGGRDGLTVEFAPTDAEILDGDLLLSSPLGGRLPAGLPIGRVSASDSGQGDLFQRVRVAPFADFARLEQVLVMTGFEVPTPGAAGAAPAGVGQTGATP